MCNYLHSTAECKSTWKNPCPLRIHISSTCLDRQRTLRRPEAPWHRKQSETLRMRQKINRVTNIFFWYHYYCFFSSEGCLTCSSWSWSLHIALGHFGEGVQLPHQTQGFLPGQTPHLRVRDTSPPPPPTHQHIFILAYFQGGWYTDYWSTYMKTDYEFYKNSR